MSQVLSSGSRFNFSDLSLLIVDDNDFARSFTRDICRSFKCREVFVAKTPATALSTLQNHDVDLIITEWEFPEVPPVDFIKCIRTLPGIRNPDVPIIVLTAQSDLGTVAEARDAGTTEFLMRPLILGQLVSRITHAMTHPRPFIRSESYIGPDRRRKARPFLGKERRLDAKKQSPSSLAKALAERVLRAGGLSIEELVAAGETVIASAEENYGAVRRQDLAELNALARQLKTAGGNHEELIRKIYGKAHDLKGMGETFGYPMLTDAGDLLCKLLWKLPPQRAATAFISQTVETHAMVMNLVVDQNLRDRGGPVGGELIQGLRELVERAGAAA
jgi:two-component system, chemotaxis family, chemotaxis protein CheY